MSKKFALKKRAVEGTCRALRCKVGDDLAEYETLERGAVLLCPKHLQQAQGGAPTEPAAPAAPTPPVAPTAPTAPATPVVDPPADPDAKTAVVVEHASVIALVNPLRTEYTDMVTQLRAALVVNSQPRLDMAGELLKQVKGKMKELEAERKKITKPLLDAKKAVDNLFRPATDAAALVEELLKNAISGYIDGQRAAKVAALQAGDHEGALATIEPELPAGVSTRTVWKWKLVDANLVPSEYWAIDAARVQEHVNTFKGQSQIPGIEVFPETGIASGSM